MLFRSAKRKVGQYKRYIVVPLKINLALKVFALIFIITQVSMALFGFTSILSRRAQLLYTPHADGTYPQNYISGTGPCQNPKKQLFAVIFSWIFGELGIDRFYTGYVALGILKLLTGGGCGLWYLIDGILFTMNAIPSQDGCPLVPM